MSSYVCTSALRKISDLILGLWIAVDLKKNWKNLYKFMRVERYFLLLYSILNLTFLGWQLGNFVLCSGLEAKILQIENCYASPHLVVITLLSYYLLPLPFPFSLKPPPKLLCSSDLIFWFCSLGDAGWLQSQTEDLNGNCSGKNCKIQSKTWQVFCDKGSSYFAEEISTIYLVKILVWFASATTMNFQMNQSPEWSYRN